jgi:hypothetical protein
VVEFVMIGSLMFFLEPFPLPGRQKHTVMSKSEIFWFERTQSLARTSEYRLSELEIDLTFQKEALETDGNL